MSDTARTETEGSLTAEFDEDEDDADSLSETSRVSSASARYSTSDQSEYGPTS